MNFIVLSVDHTREYVHHTDPQLRAYNDRKRAGLLRRNIEHRCRHGFICDPEPGPNSVWLCPHCACTWKAKSRKPCTNNKAGEIVLAMLKSRQFGTYSELYDALSGTLTRDQVSGGLSTLRRAGQQIPRLKKSKPRREKPPIRRRDGLPDFSKDNT